MNQVCRAVPHPTLREILSLLRPSDMAAGHIASLDQSCPTISGHLKQIGANR